MGMGASSCWLVLGEMVGIYMCVWRPDSKIHGEYKGQWTEYKKQKTLTN